MNNPNFNEILSEALAKYNRKTNADRIRTMSDEELAEFLRPVKCVDCHLLDCGVEEMNFKKTCEERILDWLKEEAKDE